MKIEMRLDLPILLTLLFVILKVVGVITWSWLWVLSPLWIVVAGMVLIILLTTGVRR